ncbi:hypothetical protein Holit_03278 [Hollandina sp. SP2]
MERPYPPQGFYCMNLVIAAPPVPCTAQQGSQLRSRRNGFSKWSDRFFDGPPSLGRLLEVYGMRRSRVLTGINNIRSKSQLWPI